MMKTTVHIISHSHWDREWYQSFESHRMKLIELVDNILDKAENDPEFGGFFLDGQVIAIDDGFNHALFKFVVRQLFSFFTQ